MKAITRDRKIGRRLGLSFALLLLLLAVVSGVGYWGVKSISGTTFRMLEKDATIAEHAAGLWANIVGMRRFEKDVVLNIDAPGRARDYYAKWSGERNEVEKRIADLEEVAVSREDRKKVRSVKDNLVVYTAGFRKVYALLGDGKITTPSAANAAVDEFKDSTHEMENIAEAFAREANGRMDAVKGLVEAKSSRTVVALAVLSFLVILVLVDNLAYAIAAGRAFERQNLLNEELTRSREQLRDLARDMQSAREEERTAVAREIHDALGQELTVMKMEVSWLEKRLAHGQPSLREKAASVKESIDAAIGTVRRIASELRPGVLDHLGIAAALAWQANSFANRTGIACAVASPETLGGLGKDRETALFRIFQEALTNVARHSGADRVEVALAEDDGAVVLTVADNGKGICGGGGNCGDGVEYPGSLGLIGMRERVRPFGGAIEVEGRDGCGTRLKVRIPFAGKETEA